MRKYLYALLCAATVLMYASCASSTEDSSEEETSSDLVSHIFNLKQLNDRVNSMNSECPINLGMFGQFTSVYIDDFEVVMRLEVSEKAALDFSAMRDNMDQFKNGFLSSMVGSEDTKTFLGEIAGANAEFTLRMIQFGSSDSIDFHFSNEEVKYILYGGDKESTPREKVEIMAKNSNVQCPHEVDDITVMTKVCVEDDYLTYYYTIDEEDIRVADMIASKNELKATYKERLMVDDPVIKLVRTTCKEANIGIRYIYIGSTSKKQLKIAIESSEL